MCMCVGVHVRACMRVNYELPLAADKPSSPTCRSRGCSCEQTSARRRWLTIATGVMQAARSVTDGRAQRVGPVHLMTAGPERLNSLSNHPPKKLLHAQFRATVQDSHQCNLDLSVNASVVTMESSSRLLL